MLLPGAYCIWQRSQVLESREAKLTIMKTNIKLLANSSEPFAVLIDSFKNGKYTCYSFDDNTHFDATQSYINESKNINNKLDVERYIARLESIGYSVSFSGGKLMISLYQILLFY